MTYSEYIASLNKLEEQIKESKLKQSVEVQNQVFNQDRQISELKKELEDYKRLCREQAANVRWHCNQRISLIKEGGYAERKELSKKIGELKYQWEQQKALERAAGEGRKEVQV